VGKVIQVSLCVPEMES